MRGYSAETATAAALPPHKILSQAQNACDEIRNMIFKFLMVQEDAIVPVVTHPGSVNQAWSTNCDLGANFLFTGKQVLNEALPVLLGASTFEVTIHFNSTLGRDRAIRTTRGRLIKRVIIKSTHIRLPVRVAASPSLPALMSAQVSAVTGVR
jgi:hypothetical protein